MACSSCGDNVAPKCNKDFTETVVKINNPSKIILFRKVVVPSSMGDEEDFPPTVGKYRNVLLQYEATGSIYLYSSDGIPTQISTDVSELIRRINELGVEIRVEKEERIAGDEALSEEIDSLSSSLSDEAAAREAADAALQDNIDAEEQARRDADDGLSADIVAEAQARANADTALGNRIDGVISDLSDEATARQNADNTLQDHIDNEATARQEADTALQGNINTVSNNLSAEIINRQSADTTLQHNIDSEASTRALADTALNGAITSESNSRQAADNSLQSQIDSIVAGSDVKDIVGTHAELEDYDTSTLGNNDIIKVLQDETQNDATTYYRWSTQTQSFSLIGSEGPYYTKSQTDTLLNDKQDTLTAGSNVQIVGNTISATDTKYTAGNGLNLSGIQFSVDTSTIATKSDIPTVNNATLTIQKNGTTIQTFTANSGTNKTANITVPTNNNELTNGAGYQTAADVQTAIAGKQDKLTAGNAIDITNNVISADVRPADYFTGDATSCDEGTTIETEDPIGIASVELKGNTFQQTYSGKNLFDSSSFTAGYINASGTVISDSGSNNALFDYIDVNPNTDYTASYNGSGTVQIQFAFFDSSKTFISRVVYYDYVKARKITTPANCTYLRVWMRRESAWTQDIVNESNLQLEQGTATTFEPYVGGIPAPNPDYPQEVQTATGRQVVDIYGKNLFNNTATPTFHAAGITIETTDTGVKITNSAAATTSNSNWCLFLIGKASDYAGKTVTLSATRTLSGISSSRAYIGLCNANGENRLARAQTNDDSINLSWTVEEDSTSPYLCVVLYSSSGVVTSAGAYAEYQNVQLELGSTATSYESHQGYEINLGKNLVTLENATFTSEGITSTKNGGSITVTGTNTRQDLTYRFIDNGSSVPLPHVLPAGTYTISYDTVTGATSSQALNFNFRDSDNAIIVSGIRIDPNTHSRTFTLNKDAYRFRVAIEGLTVNVAVNIKYDGIQLEKGPTATSYAPYFEPIELCKIGEYQDYIYKSGGNWYLHKETGKAVLDGSGTWYRQTTSGGVNYRFSVTVSDIKQDVTGVVGYSDKLIPVTTDTYSQDGISGTSSAQRISIRYDSIFGQMTIEEVQAWLADNPITAYYVLATPTDTQITNADLIAQLEALWGATTYDNKTVFTVTSENLPGILDVCTFNKTLEGTLAKIDSKQDEIDAGYGIKKNGSTVSVDTGEIATQDDLDGYLPLAGGAITGAITRNLGSGAIANTNIFTLTGSTDGFAVDYDSSTSDLGITKIYSTDDANAQLSLGNKVGSNYKEAINITNGVATVNGNSSTATKLATPRTIGLGTGATGTATSFDGSADITIPVTDVKESYVTWGGKNHIDGDMTPGVMGCVDEFSHNKFAFLPAQLIAVAYSQDGGSTWTDYSSITNDMKVQLVTYDANVSLYTGGRATATNTASDDRLRVRIHNLDGTANLIYTSLKEILINISSDGASGMKVQIRNRTIGNYQNNVENWTTVGTYDLLGRSGWNSIPYIYRFGGSSNQTGNVGEMELIFWATGRASTNSNMRLKMLRFIGSDTWSAQSEMAKTGRLYTIDASQNATFPANVKVTGSLQHSSYTYQLPSANGTLATITMTTTDPGEGASIADGQFIAVYDA